MKETNGIKYWLDKLVFSAILIASILGAYLLVRAKSGIPMSRPIKIGFSGISLKMPSGRGWQLDEKWKKQQNQFVRNSTFIMSSDTISPTLSCRYILAAPDSNITELLRQNASLIKGDIIKTDRQEIEGLAVDTAHIINSEAAVEILFATANLGNNQRLTIEILQTTANSELGTKALEMILKSLQKTDCPAIRNAQEIMAAIKQDGLISPDDSNQKTLLLIKNSGGYPIGFESNHLSKTDNNSDFGIQVTNIFYIKGNFAEEELSILQCDNSLNKFYWRRRGADRFGFSFTEMKLDGNSVLTIISPNAQTKLNLSSLALPEALIGPLLKKIQKSPNKTFVLEIIDADASILPVSISKEQNGLKMEVFNAFNLSQKISLDSEGNILKIIQEESGITIEKADVEEILKYFPDHSKFLKNDWAPKEKQI